MDPRAIGIIQRDNILKKIPESLPEELLEKLVETRSVKIERIVSWGHTTPEGSWYDQETNEWVLVVRGRARLRFETNSETVALETGDWVCIPAHEKHRVEWTDPSEETIWLAVHF